MFLFSYPVKPFNQFKLDAGFLDENYRKTWGKNHRGIDINGKGGGDTDLGAPVINMFPGVVVEAGNFGSWGGIVLVSSEPWVTKIVSERLNIPIGHLEIQYAHLNHITVRVGEGVNSGAPLGAIGKGGNNQYVAHLHLEARKINFPASRPQGSDSKDRSWIQENCLDPKLLFNSGLLSDESNVLDSRRYTVQAKMLVASWKDGPVKYVRSLNNKLFVRDAD